MTDDDLSDIETWLANEQAGNRYLNERMGKLSGSELACEHVAALLAEVERLRAELEESQTETAHVTADDFVEYTGCGDMSRHAPTCKCEDCAAVRYGGFAGRVIREGA